MREDGPKSAENLGASLLKRDSSLLPFLAALTLLDHPFKAILGYTCSKVKKVYMSPAIQISLKAPKSCQIQNFFLCAWSNFTYTR
jgi:hypothetical protein